jgi:hypothetical protein
MQHTSPVKFDLEPGSFVASATSAAWTLKAMLTDFIIIEVKHGHLADSVLEK